MYNDWFAAEVYKNYLYCAEKIILVRGGIFTACDGDRVMGVFIGDSKNSAAAMCVLQINWAPKKNRGSEDRQEIPEEPLRAQVFRRLKW
ncbi:hypothetical protein QP968_05630 [Corynebacterium sp. MSK041]|nr:hypothetical protein [Corynebacterium sp. MSK041]